jgi:four helix bundle protein
MIDALKEKSFAFAVRVLRLSEFLNNEKKEFVISRKILDSGANIGLLIEEGRQGENRADFAQKYSVANKEAFKTNFLLRLLKETGYINESQAESLLLDREELQKMLISALTTTRARE